MPGSKTVSLMIVLLLSLFANEAQSNDCAQIRRQILTASKSGQNRLLKRLMEQAEKQDCKVYNTHGGHDSYLMAAARNRHYQAVKLLLEYGLDIDTEERQPGSSLRFKTALMEAVEKKDTALLKFLLENGADPEHKTRDAVSGLDIVRENGDITTLEVLIPYIANKQEFLFKILRQQPDVHRTEIIKLLLDYGVDVNVQDTLHYDQATPLMAAVANPFIVKDAQLEIVKLLLANGAEVNSRNKNGQTAIFIVICIAGSNYDLAALLMENGAEVFCFDEKWRTPFINALAAGNFAIMVLIIWKVLLMITLVLALSSCIMC